VPLETDDDIARVRRALTIKAASRCARNLLRFAEANGNSFRKRLTQKVAEEGEEGETKLPHSFHYY